MEINYWVVFFVTVFLTAYKLVKTANNFSWKKLEDIGIIVIAIPSFVGGLVCVLFNCFSSAVFEIKDNQKHKERDYLFYYTDYKDETHIVVPFTNYLSNASNREVKLSKVGYGKKMHNKYNDEFFPVGVFRSIEGNPDYYFTTPPKYIRSKSSGTVRYIINYK